MIAKESAVKYGRFFGQGDVYGLPGNEMSKMSKLDRAKAMGWSHACPVVDAVVSKYGEDWTLKRYIECNHIWDLAADRARILNHDLWLKMITPTARLPGEIPDPKMTRDNVPPDFEKEMSPLSTVPGYAFPRTVLVWAGINAGKKDNSGTNSKERVGEIKLKLDKVIQVAKDPIDLTLLAAEEAVKMKADVRQIVGHLLDQGILKEEGCKTMFKEIILRMVTVAPNLWEEYNKMLDDPALMAKEGIIIPKQLE